MKTARTLSEHRYFPHRGTWRVEAIKITLCDQLELAGFRWILRSAAANAEVKPPPAAGALLPILSSCSRSGDELPSPHRREGDLFDLKRYHPSDGMKRIVWKIFAKRGILISRDPEQSVTPEGRVVVYGLASTADDPLCGKLLAYLRQLETLGLEIFFACEGINDGRFARTAQEAENLLVAAVWDTLTSTPSQTAASVASFLAALQPAAASSRPEQLLLFCSPSRMHQKAGLQICLDVGEYLERSRILPIYILLYDKALHAAVAAPKRARSPRARLAASVASAFLFQEPDARLPKPVWLPEFLSTCRRKGWQVIEC